MCVLAFYRATRDPARHGHLISHLSKLVQSPCQPCSPTPRNMSPYPNDPPFFILPPRRWLYSNAVRAPRAFRLVPFFDPLR
ncbi:hypothetical protein OF83DRAFT_625463 [Amylostereum chailletii]|nr:hypothetical protein OF83DRAFT_625463 [Amylostereum chailletii]